MSVLGMLLFVVGVGIAVIGGLGLLIEGFSKSVFWGLGMLFFSPVSLVFVVVHWNEAKKTFLLQLAGTGIAIAGIVIMALADGGASY